jgi:hypothetical protein
MTADKFQYWIYDVCACTCDALRRFSEYNYLLEKKKKKKGSLIIIALMNIHFCDVTH